MSPEERVAQRTSLHPWTDDEVVSILRADRQESLRVAAMLLWAAGGYIAVPDRVLITLRDDDTVEAFYDPATRITHYRVTAAPRP